MDKVATEKLAVVTGGGSGIGLAIAKQFIAAGIRTIIIGRSIEKLKKAKEELGENCNYRVADLAVLGSIPELVADIESNFGPIHILVNNAGINLKKDFTEVTDEEFAAVLHTNVAAVFSISREVVKGMLQRKAGVIINISSMASQYGLPKVIAYSASKAAIEGMTRAMAVELSPYGIRINCIAPGFIATDMSAKALQNDPERMQKVLSRTPMGELGPPDAIGSAALFLASDASFYITGTVIPVDGGNSIGF